MKRKQSLLERINGKLAVPGMVCGLIFSFAPEPVRAQGLIDYTIRVPGLLFSHVYEPEVSDPMLAKVGNTALETLAGTQTYTGARLEGPAWSAQLFAAQGSGQPEGALVPVAASVTTFRTGSTLGGTIASSELAIPNVPPHQIGTFQLRAWDNLGGTLTSWSAAEPLWVQGSIAAGKSILFDLQTSGGLEPLAVMEGFRSFNVYFVPEPSAIALAILGGTALLVHLRRRRRPPPPESESS